MTWVIGASSIFGHGLVISDVRVSFSNGTEQDMLRKCYQVGPYLLAGFAGSVDIGFRLIECLQHCLLVPDLPEDAVWRPEVVAEEWSPIAAKLFAESDPREQAGGAQILMVGISPTEHMGDPKFRRVYVTSFCWPDFTPVHMPKGVSVCHIGSGADVELYKSRIAGSFEVDSPPSMAGLQAGPGAWSTMIGSNIGRIVSDRPVPGISPHVFIDTVALRNFRRNTNDQTRFEPDGTNTDFLMPPVASSHAEFKELCRKLGLASARAVA
ncbi:hypothetical protein [Afifella aestuarii]|uniref:hypothetical protein n=1 Tax=Afifella aestuarii TaxID=1909496 RepID=UPI000FE3D004|nr:hypothetical protein [Afifella aestuarii]